ncbi:WxL domain-containing protein [Enterococcus faecium]|nr:WxL domain-containing protein [Enterococcus faecium]
MKKSKILFSAASILSNLLVVTGVFADQTQTATSSSAETPVTVTLNAPTTTTPKAPTDPTDPTKGGNEETPGGTIGENGKLGIAYYPKTFTFTGNLGKDTLMLHDSSNSMSSNATYNVGVKDETRQNNQWTLTAQLIWNENALPGSTITVTNPNKGNVMKNTNNGTDEFQTSNLVSQNDVQGTVSNVVTINTVGSTEIMKKGQGMVGKGTYDYCLGTLGSLQLTIPNAMNLEAKTYSGNVNWNLSVTP